MNKAFSRTLLALGLVAALGATQASFAAQTAATENAASEQAAFDISSLTPEQKTAYLAHSGRMAMSYVEAARENLQGGNSDEAKQQLSEAQTLLDSIQGNSDKDSLPLFARIGFTEQVEVTDDINNKLQGVNEHIVKGDHGKVVAAMKTTGAAMAYSYAEMSLTGTISKVDEAIKAIIDNDAAKAEQALVAAVDGINIETLNVAAEQS